MLGKACSQYDLKGFHKEFVSVKTLRATGSAIRGAREAGLSLAEVVVVIQGLARKDFYKSMTSDRDSKVWQDVYLPTHGDLALYVKLTMSDEGRLLISFKLK